MVCKNEVDTRYNIFQSRTFSRVLGHMTLHPRMPPPMPVVHILLHGISGSALAWPLISVRPLYVWVSLFLYTYTLVNRARFASRFAARFALAISSGIPTVCVSICLICPRSVDWHWYTSRHARHVWLSTSLSVPSSSNYTHITSLSSQIHVALFAKWNISPSSWCFAFFHVRAWRRSRAIVSGDYRRRYSD